MIAVRPAVSAACGLVLALSLALKLPHLTGTAKIPPNPNSPEIALLLENEGFQTRQLAREDDFVWVIGRTGRCVLRVTEISPIGWHQSLIAGLAAGQQLFYAFDGQIYPEQPTVRTRIYAYWSRLNRYLGLSAPNRPVLAIIAAPTCENVPLRDLAALSGR